MPLLYDQVPISGHEGTVQLNINGSVREWITLKSFAATIDIINDEYRVMGGNGATRYKYTGWSGSGEITYHYMDSTVTKIVLGFIKSGKYPDITMVVTNDDPASSAGNQSISLMHVMFPTVEIAKLDVSTSMLEGSTSFTFSDVEDLELFSDL